MQDTFYVDIDGDDGIPYNLRPHTSPMQVRYAHQHIKKYAGREMPEIFPWEYAAHFMGAQVDLVRAPKTAREALLLAISTERRTQNFYVDVAEHTDDDTMCAFAAEMAHDESRHIARLERLLAREPEAATTVAGEGDVLPLKP